MLLRLLTPSDLDAVDRLRAKAGWNQTLGDWQRFLELEPNGCFVLEVDGHVIGSVTTTRYGADVAWIGMVLVDELHRRRGYGRRLLEAATESLRSRGVRSIALDATPLGEPLYRELGFRSVWGLERWRGRLPAGVRSAGVRELQATDIPALGALDRCAFGVDRGPLLEQLLAHGARGAVCERDGEFEGFGFLRPGARAAYLGPMVGRTSQVARELVETLSTTSPQTEAVWDIPLANTAALTLAGNWGFEQERTLERMVLGADLPVHEPGLQCAIADPALG